jgi:MFS family permease
MPLPNYRFPTRNTLISIVLIANAFVWYYFISELLKDIVETSVSVQGVATAIWSAHYGGIILSAIAGYWLTKKIKNRTDFLIVWMIVGSLTSLLSMFVDLTSAPTILSLALLWGVTLGIGLPCCMGYFVDNVEVSSRGRIGGITLLITGLGMFALGMFGGDNLGVRTFIMTAWRTFGLLFLVAVKEKDIAIETQDTSYKDVIKQRSFLLYLAPWIMFSLITYLTTPIQNGIVGKQTMDFLIIFENVIIAVFALVGGFLMDRVGRKRLSILGFVLLGLGYSVLGLGDSTNMISWYFYTVVDGVAWGVLFVIFVVTIWGDLSNGKRSDKFYAIGVLPFFASKYLQLTIGTQIAQDIPASSIFSLTALFLFLAVLPLFYAPETLPEKIMKDRDLKSYVEKAQQKAQKETEKINHNQQTDKKTPNQSSSEPEDDKNHEEARKLAEKYY